MPRPLPPRHPATPSKAASNNTHTATLIAGKSYTLVTAGRLGNPLQFQEGIPKDIPHDVMELLKRKAKDNVTTTTGSKVSGKLQAKFKFVPLKGAKVEAGEAEEEEEEADES